MFNENVASASANCLSRPAASAVVFGLQRRSVVVDNALREAKVEDRFSECVVRVRCRIAEANDRREGVVLVACHSRRHNAVTDTSAPSERAGSAPRTGGGPWSSTRAPLLVTNSTWKKRVKRMSPLTLLANDDPADRPGDAGGVTDGSVAASMAAAHKVLERALQSPALHRTPRSESRDGIVCVSASRNSLAQLVTGPSSLSGNLG